MEKQALYIRPVQEADNEALAKTLREVLVEMGVPKVGTAYADVALDCMHATYAHPQMAYFVLTDGERILGGAGVAPLEAHKGTVCELQKMYFLAEVRGMGMGAKMMETCLQQARDFGFDQIYLETMPNMLDAQKLYRKYNFAYLEAPMGNTGHFSCPVWMLRKL